MKEFKSLILDVELATLQMPMAKRDGSGILMVYPQGQVSPVGTPFEALTHEIEQFTGQKARTIMVNAMEFGIIAPVHTDFVVEENKTLYDRWHLPLATNKDALFWGENVGYVHMQKGIWYGPIEYWERHTVMNLGKNVRTHLIVDLERK